MSVPCCQMPADGEANHRHATQFPSSHREVDHQQITAFSPFTSHSPLPCRCIPRVHSSARHGCVRASQKHSERNGPGASSGDRSNHPFGAPHLRFRFGGVGARGDFVLLLRWDRSPTRVRVEALPCRDWTLLEPLHIAMPAMPGASTSRWSWLLPSPPSPGRDPSKPPEHLSIRVRVFGCFWMFRGMTTHVTK